MSEFDMRSQEYHDAYLCIPLFTNKSQCIQVLRQSASFCFSTTTRMCRGTLVNMRLILINFHYWTLSVCFRASKYDFVLYWSMMFHNFWLVFYNIYLVQLTIQNINFRYSSWGFVTMIGRQYFSCLSIPECVIRIIYYTILWKTVKKKRNEKQLPVS